MPAPYFDPQTGFAYPSSAVPEFHYTPSKAELEEAMRTMILSASGWRKVFAADGDEENPVADLKPVDRVITMGMALNFVHFLRARQSEKTLRVALGLDARFTGPHLADGILRVLLASGVEVDYLGIVAAPEIMAWVQNEQIHAGFIYVSASHNPIGHNGFKWGRGDGGVIGGKDSAELISAFQSSLTPENAAGWFTLAQKAEPDAVERVYRAMPSARSRAALSYRSLSDTIFALTDDAKIRGQRLRDLQALVKSSGVGIVGELNGSARGLSIDQSWLEGLGIKTIYLNDRPRQIVHAIVPEGTSLDLCKTELEKLHKLDPQFVLGYVPDCDGDRGNVVFFDPELNAARILEAQEVFALCVLSELAGLFYFGEQSNKIAVVANDPTSFRIDAIAHAFGAQVFRAEVGEANVVAKARQLREDGWMVRILGEGSNGGNITFPGSVRDPLSTLGSLLKLLCLRSASGTPGLYEIWCRQSQQPQSFLPDYSLADILRSLPPWTTTPASQTRAILKIRSMDHGKLKAVFEQRWIAHEWPRLSSELFTRWGVKAWKVQQYEGTEERIGWGPEFRTGKQTGGWKIVLLNQADEPAASLWMRGSGTEPVFRIQAEVRGSDAHGEQWLIEWLTGMVRSADAEASH